MKETRKRVAPSLKTTFGRDDERSNVAPKHSRPPTARIHTTQKSCSKLCSGAQHQETSASETGAVSSARGVRERSAGVRPEAEKGAKFMVSHLSPSFRTEPNPGDLQLRNEEEPSKKCCEMRRVSAVRESTKERKLRSNAIYRRCSKPAQFFALCENWTRVGPLP